MTNKLQKVLDELDSNNDGQLSKARHSWYRGIVRLENRGIPKAYGKTIWKILKLVFELLKSYMVW